MAKKVSASLQVTTDIKNKGLLLSVSEDETLLGYLEVGKAKLSWFDKHAKNPNGEATWEEFIAWVKQRR